MPDAGSLKVPFMPITAENKNRIQQRTEMRHTNVCKHFKMLSEQICFALTYQNSHGLAISLCWLSNSGQGNVLMTV